MVDEHRVDPGERRAPSARGGALHRHHDNFHCYRLITQPVNIHASKDLAHPWHRPRATRYLARHGTKCGEGGGVHPTNQLGDLTTDV